MALQEALIFSGHPEHTAKNDPAVSRILRR